LKTPASLVRPIHALWQRKGVLSTLLLPLSWMAQLAIARKRRRYHRQPGLQAHSRRPVLIVGNLYVGGTGKTPVVIALVQALQARGWRPGVISRGYGIKPGSQARTGRGNLDPREFGDEPALIAQITGVPLAVHPQRALALRQLEQDYPDVDLIIADDGLQHLALARDVELVVQDARGLGNGRVLPAGPLREPASKLADIDVLITNLPAGQKPPPPLPIRARQVAMCLEPDRVMHVASHQSLDWKAWQDRYGQARISAVAGIGQPDRFFAMLKMQGIRLEQAIALPDHDPFATSPFDALSSELVVITAKDAVKCAHFHDERLWAVHVAPRFSDSAWIGELDQRLHELAKKKSA
jgi:tetraacyldisaccharide 4'-kinase